MRSVPLASFLAVVVAALAPAAFAEPKIVPTTITAVTVYPDRAQVTRTGAADVPVDSSTTTLRINKLPGWIDPESVRIALDPPSAGQILDVSIETAFLAEATDESVRNAQNAVRDISDDVTALADEERTLNEEIERLVALRTLSIDKVPRELAVGDIKVKALGETMIYVTDTIRADRKQLRTLAKKRRDLEPVLAQKQRELSEVDARAHLQQSSVTVEIRGANSNAKAHLRLTYLTPGAAWEPIGEVRVTRNGSMVNVVQSASVTQTTGEDWSNAKLSFSTQNPSDNLDVPRARGLMLDKSGAGLGSVLGASHVSESFSRAQQIYVDGNEIVAKNKSEWRQSIAMQQEIQTRAVERFSQIAKRGTTAHFVALGEKVVRADGKPVRVPIASGDFAAKTKIVAVPESSLNAVRVAELINGGTNPILPGRAMLFEDGAFVGRSELDFVAPGESFTVFLGVHDRVKLERQLDRKSSALKRKGKRTEMGLSFIVTAENLGATPLTIELSERVPVAQTDEITVSDIELPNKLKPDAQGVVHWTETIPARTKQAWRVHYKLEYPSDFVARARNLETAPAASPMPSAAPPRRKMYEQIDEMEKTL